jgi:hypothetical protein
MWKLGLAALIVLATAGSAAAGPARKCAAAGDDPIEIDGMLDDWDGVERIRGGGNAADASFDLRCLFDGTFLYLSVDVRDEHVVRNGKTPAGEDRVEITVDAGKAALAITLYPGKDRAAPRRQLGGKALPSWLAAEDTLQPKGWSAELKVPLAKVPGWGPSVPVVSASARYQDADVPKLALTENTVEWSGALTLGNADSLHAQLLAELKLSAAQVTLDAQADLDPTRPGPERVIAGGAVVALLTDVYGYVQLPVAKGADVLEVELVDLTGDARRFVAARLRQRGGGGTREVLMLYTARNGKLEELHAIEIGKEQAGKRLRSTWAVEGAKPWKQAKGARKVLVVRAQPAVGWDEDTYNESPSPDADAIHVPWDDDRIGGVYWLSRDGLSSAAIKR